MKISIGITAVFLLLTVGTTPLEGDDTVPGWEMQKSGTTASLRGVCAVSETAAWASGSKFFLVWHLLSLPG